MDWIKLCQMQKEWLSSVELNGGNFAVGAICKCPALSNKDASYLIHADVENAAEMINLKMNKV